MHPDDILVPSEEQLAELDREVCFVPVDNERPKALSPEQVRQYNSLGYLLPFDGLNTEEVLELRTYFDGVLKPSEIWEGIVILSALPIFDLPESTIL